MMRVAMPAGATISTVKHLVGFSATLARCRRSRRTRPTRLREVLHRVHERADHHREREDEEHTLDKLPAPAYDRKLFTTIVKWAEEWPPLPLGACHAQSVPPPLGKECGNGQEHDQGDEGVDRVH